MLPRAETDWSKASVKLFSSVTSALVSISLSHSHNGRAISLPDVVRLDTKISRKAVEARDGLVPHVKDGDIAAHLGNGSSYRKADTLAAT